ncbi:MAG: hypothetical protein PHR44_02445 [Candidatus Omnitrophica bacterium]|nr:hypothetical protein [Candidatus Omnitrophota bacterium]
MFEENIFKKILETWSSDQHHPYRDRRKKPLPSITDLKIMIETLFLASLKREEGGWLTFATVLLAKDKLEQELKTSERKQLILNFDKSIPFIESSITKLASAFDPKISALIVGPREGNSNEYEIWGVMFFRPSHNRFNEISAGMPEFSYFRPDLMMVTVVSPGSLIISRGDSRIGHLTAGTFVAATPTPFTSHAMGNYIIECIKGDEGYKKYQNSYWHIFRDSIEYLLSEVSVRGHGGTLIIVPGHMKKECSKGYVEKYPFDRNLEIEKIILKLLNLPVRHSVPFDILLYRLLSERLSFLAQLSSVDGALIITSNFNPISFGATLNSGEWNGKVIIGSDGFNSGGKELNTANFGTRHSSALNFVGNFYGVVGFVISQDGPIRGFIRKDDNTILCWPDCGISMFI